MKIAKNREYTVNMGDGTYESQKIGASIEADLDVLGLTFEEGLAQLDEKLETMLDEDVRKASDITEKKNSFIHSYVGEK